MKQYGKLPPKEAETIVQDTLFVVLIRGYQFTPKKQERNSNLYQREMKRNKKWPQSQENMFIYKQ